MTRSCVCSSRPAGELVHEVRDDVVVSGLVPYGDADLVVRLLVRGLGRVGAFARGARRSRRRFPGLCAPALGRAALRERRASELWELVEVDLDPVVLGLASDPRALGFAAYLVELCERLLPEAEPNPDVFDLTTSALRVVATTGARAVLLRAFELQLLRQLGWLPDLHQVDGPVTAFDAEAGRLLSTPSAGAVQFPEEARAAALALLASPLDALPDLDPATARGVSRLFGAALARHVTRPLKSVAFLRSLGPTDAPATDGIAGPRSSR
ncbi:MAG: DNA repair protein RecO [Deltaproteobacteria bacterium RBG_16_71_12]|nr:MAG: DNA repair protein RecO [Deltaproteobacteria bacterium RBG_16_71_12]